MNQFKKNPAISRSNETVTRQEQTWVQEIQTANSTETDDLLMSTECHKPTDERECQESEDDGVPYDRGWAWVVACGCFVNYILLSGSLKCLGIFYVELLQRFHSSASKTGFLFSLKAGVVSLSSGYTGGLETGPFVMTVVVGRLGNRWTALTGAVMLALGMTLSSLVSELMVIICLMGILIGLGQAMLTSPGEVLMGTYFRKRQFLAMILAKCGASVGNTVLPLLVTYFLEEYGLCGTLLLTGGLCLHCIPATMLFRPISYYTKQTKRKRGRTENEPDLEGSSGLELRKTLIECDLTRGTVNMRTMSQRPDFMGETKPFSFIGDAPKTVFDVESANSKSTLQLKKVFDVKNSPKRPALSFSENDVTRFQQDTRSASDFLKKGDYISTHTDKQKSDESFATILKTVSNPEINVAAFCRKSDSHMGNNFNKEHALQSHSTNDTNNFDVRSQSKQKFLVSGTTAEEHSSTMSFRSKKCPKYPISMDFSVFGRPLFRLLLAFFVLFHTLNVMANYLPALAHENDITESQVAQLLSIIGGLDFVSRLSCAVIANAKVARVSTITATAFFILGVTSQFVRYMTSFNHFLVLSVLLGLLGSVGNLMIPVLVLDFVGLEKMPEALGFVLLVTGASSASTYPLPGFIRDITGSYLVVYHVVGGAAILAAGLLFCEKWVRRLEHGKEKSEMK